MNQTLGERLALFHQPLGYTRKGVPIYPIAGGDGTAAPELDRKLDELLGEMRKANRILEQEQLQPSDGGRKAAALEAQAAIAASATAVDDQRQANGSKADLASERERLLEQRIEAMERAMGARSGSKARLLAGGQSSGTMAGRLKAGAMGKAHPVMDATWVDYVPGEFLGAVQDVKNLGDGIDLDVIARGKAKLQELGLVSLGLPQLSRAGYHIVDAEGKATLGATGATGGYVLPNNLVDTVVKPHTQRAVLQLLVTVVNGVSVRGVDQPYRLGAPARMAFQDWGATKENVNETYGTYTAVLGTIARVMDISKQYARFSAGAAEQDVMDELTRAAILGENYYLMVGQGTGDVGTGDPTTGIHTALKNASAFTTAHSAVGTTLAGSAAAGLAKAFGALAARSREAEAVVVDAVTFWTMLAQGTDTAGFWVDPTGGPTGFTRTASGSIAFWGTPVYYDANMDANVGANSGSSKGAIVGEWSALKLYRGMEFRIDSTDVAGTRWDQNLIGFRAEEEIGFNARTAVTVGAMQLVTGLIP